MFVPLVALAAPVLLTSTATASDTCELPTDLAIQAEQAVVEGRFDDMEALVPRFEASLSCAPPVDPETLAAFLRAEAAWFHLTQFPDEARIAFRSAALLAPDAWTDAFGAELKTAYDAAARTESPGRGSIQLEPPPADPTLVVYIDGRETTFPLELNAGIHALQLVRGPESLGTVGTARYGSLVAVFPNEDVRVNPGVLPIEEAPALVGGPRRPVWLLAAAGGAVAVSAVTAAIAMNQPDIARQATSLAGVNKAEQRQRAMAFTSYGFLGAGAVAGGVYLAW